MKSISVVIPNYNGRKLLEKNLPTIFRALRRVGADYEVIVPDDNSKDDSVEFLRGHYPEIKVITSSVNLGFAGNINKGLRAATKDLVLALNSDVALTDDYFVHQMEYFNDPSVFGVMGAMKDPANDKLIVGAKVCRQNLFGDIDATKNIITDPPEVLDTFYLSGANALIDTAKLRQIGFFNEIYSPFYKEDIDLSLSAWRMGWRCLFEPRAVAFHETSSTILKHNRRKYVKYISKRNKFIFHYIHLGGLKRFLFFAKLGLDIAVRWVALDATFYKAVLAFFRMLPRVKVARARLPAYVKSTQQVIAELAERRRPLEFTFF